MKPQSRQRPKHSKPQSAFRNAPDKAASRQPVADGLAARDAAASALFAVFVEKRAFDDAFAKASETRNLSARDRAFARLIATTVLRHRGPLNAVIKSFLEKPLPENQGRLEPILLSAAAQLLYLKTPPHAAISLAVDQCRVDRAARRFDKLANAVLRRVSEQGAARLAAYDAVSLTFPDWLLARWIKVYGPERAREIAAASLVEAPLDLSVISDAEGWAERLNGTVLPTGSIRLTGAGKIEELDGFDDGAWWVQDAAAALPAKLFGDLAGLNVLDLCAAPGGKTAQLAAAGANVTAVDKSPGRLNRLKTNLARLKLTADTIVADAAEISVPNLFDAVLVDAPCTATGTIRRHPDILYLKRPEDVAALAALQARIIDHAKACVKPGGTIIYCTCSLEPEEGEDQISRFLERNRDFERRPITEQNVFGRREWITPDGDVRTLPCHLAELPAGLSGMDGFFISRLLRTA